MIENIRNVKPKISFGLGATEISKPIGETFYVWQNTTHNDTFILAITTPTGLTITKINNYQFSVVGTIAGIYELQCLFVKSGVKLESNKITITIT
jgi:hypothetical protein